MRRLTAVASSCDSLAVRSGLSMTASTCPLDTVSPACTFSVTVPRALAYSVGLTAATTWPSAAMSRTKLPRSTVAIDSRDRSTDDARSRVAQQVGDAARPSAMTAARADDDQRR